MRVIRGGKIFTNQHLGIRSGAVRAPDLLTRVDVIGGDKPAHAKLTPAYASNDFVADDQRYHGNGLALFNVALLDLPQLFPGLGIKGDRVRVELIEKDFARGIGRAPIHYVAAGNRNGILALDGRIFPFNGMTRIRQIDGIHDIGKGGHNIHGVANHQRRAFVSAQDAGRKRPGDLQVLRVLRGNLVQAAIAGEGVVPARSHPLTVVLLHIEQFL